MLLNLDLSKILFLDIETVPQHSGYSEMDETSAMLWGLKAERLTKDDETAEDIYQRAGIYAEFGKIVCISVGFFNLPQGGEKEFRMRSFYGDDEKKIAARFLPNAGEAFRNTETFVVRPQRQGIRFPIHCSKTNHQRASYSKNVRHRRKKAMGSTTSRHLGTVEIRGLEELHFA